MSLIPLGPLRNYISTSQDHPYFPISTCLCWLRIAPEDVALSFPTLEEAQGQNAESYSGSLKWFAGSERHVCD